MTSVGLHIAHCVLSMDCGGLEHVVLDLTRTGLRRGQVVSVVCLENPGVLARQVEELGVEVCCLHKRPGLPIFSLRRKLTEVFDELKPDVAHTHQVGALFYAGPAAKRAGVPVVVHTEHGKHYQSRQRTRWLGRIAGRWADRFFCVSADIAEEVKRFRIVPERKIAVMANGIDVERFRGQRAGEMQDARCGMQDAGWKEGDPSPCPLPQGAREELGIPAGAPVVGTVGRLAEVKRQDLLIRAFAELRRRNPEAHLLIVGDGPLRGELEDLVAELGLGETVHFTGYQTQTERYLQAMNVFVLTSRSEGMPLSVLEAWATGLPVVAMSVGGLPELIEPGRTGQLVPFGDWAELAKVLFRMTSDAEYAGKLGTNGLRLVEERYSLDQMAANYEAEYRQLAEGVYAAAVC